MLTSYSDARRPALILVERRRGLLQDAMRHAPGLRPPREANLRARLTSSLRAVPHRVFWKLAPFLSDELYVKLHFFWCHRVLPNLSSPSTFSEKIQWRKLQDRRNVLTLFGDKYRARTHVEAKVGREFLTEIYWASEDPRTLPLERLPPRFVVKVNHGTGWMIFVDDKSAIERESVVRRVRSWLAQPFPPWRREWAYRDIKPITFAEEFLLTREGHVPPDFKFFVFDGEVRLVQVDLDRFTHHTRCLYDRDWNLLPVTLAFPKGRGITRPHNLAEMIRCAEMISDGIDFVRVDLYNVDGRIVFGEMTHYPGGGFERFTPPDFDRIVGAWWRLPPPAEVRPLTSMERVADSGAR